MSRKRKRLRNAFVVGEFAVALALLSGAGFLIQAFQDLTGHERGYEVGNLLTFEVSVLQDRYEGDAAVVQYERDLVAALEEVPGVEGVAMMSSLPRGMNGGPSVAVTLEAESPVAPEERPRASLQSVNPGYFEAMGVDRLQGRLFAESDDADAQPVVIVSQSLVERDLGGGDALGRTLYLNGDPHVVVGVVENILQARMELAGDGGELAFVPAAQRPRTNPSFALRTVGDPTALAGDVRRAVWSVEPDQPVALLRSFDAHVAESLAGPRAIQSFLVVLAAIAVVLAALGIYGVLAHAVVQQRREIGIRMALGAGRGSVVGMITRTGLGLAGVGLTLGLPLAFLMYRAVQGSLGLFEADLGFAYPAAIASSLVAAAVLATWLPAHRATAVSPIAALRDDA